MACVGTRAFTVTSINGKGPYRRGHFLEGALGIVLQTELRRGADILCAPVDADNFVMMSVAHGLYYGLDAVGGRIWQLLDTPRTVGDICIALGEEFEVDDETCRADVLGFVADLVERGIVRAG